ncbi:hypothetical protein ZHAS_00013351 [Anopheles sinensis]|uniref:Uncharacterized protein n=1 Tax=Anopheles sinensis TaxID=74873 RepID=A0A084W5C6_ANOSI|nr:hypothetical protein ZHAS_00013351 [Anopheles sinensis]
MAEVPKIGWTFVLSLVGFLIVCLPRDTSGAKKPVPLQFSDLDVFSDEPKPFTVRVTKFVCVDTPYEVSELLQCKTILRRNRPTVMNITLRVPGVLNKIWLRIRTYYRFTEYQSVPFEVVLEACEHLRHPSSDALTRHVFAVMHATIPQVMHQCPHGNTTYNVSVWLEDRFFPQSTPAGDYRQDIRISTPQNKTIFAYAAFFSVRRKDIPKIKALSSLNFLTVPKLEQTEKGFRVIGKDYAATFERFVHPEIEHDNPDAVTEQLAKDLRRLDFDLTLVKSKTHYWKHSKPATTIIDAGKKNPKDDEIKQSASGNTIME